MAVYTETIKLDDGVSQAARAAQTAMASLTKGLDAAHAQLVKADALGDQDSFAKATSSAEKYAAAIAKLQSEHGELLAMGTFSPIPENHPALKAPAAASKPVAGGDSPAVASSSGGGAFDRVALSAEQATKLTGEFQAALRSAQDDLARAAALGDQAGYDAALSSVGQYTEALGRLGVTTNEIQPPPPLALDPNDAASWKTLADTARGLQDELKGVEAEMLKAQALGDGEGFNAAKTKAEELKASLAKLPPVAKKVEEDGRSMWESAADAAIVGKETISAAIDGIKAAFSALAQGDVKGAIEGVTQSIAGMAKMLDMVVPGLGQAVSAVVTIAGGLVGITAGLAVSASKFAIAANEAQQATDGMFNALGRGEMTGDEVGDMVDGLRAKLGVAGGTLEPFVQKFMTVGIVGKDALEKLTEAAISMEAVVKGGGAAFSDLYTKVHAVAETGEQLKMPFKKMQSALAAAGLNVKDLAKEMGITSDELVKGLEAGTVDAKKFGDAMQNAAIKKGAGPLATLANSTKNLGDLLNEYLGELFEDLGESIAPFMDEVKSLFAIFDSKTNPSGQALKAGIGGALKEIFGWATKVVPMVKHFLLDLIIYGLKAYIALKPIVATIKEFFASATGMAIVSGLLDGLTIAFTAVAGVVGIVVGLAVGFIAILVTMNALIGAAIGYLLSFGTTVAGAIVEAFSSLIDWVGKAPQLATDFINGLISGIAGGAAAVGQAVSNVANGAIDSFKSVLGIASPSKVMAGLGGFTAAGFAEGVESGVPDVHGAAMDLAGSAASGALPVQSSPAVTATAEAAQVAGGGSSSAGTTVVLEAGAIQISGQGKDWSEVTEEMIAAVMERLGMQIGVA